MTAQFERLLNRLLIFFITELIAIMITYRFFNEFLFFVELMLLIVNGITILIMLFLAYQQGKDRQVEIQDVLGQGSKESLLFGQVGIVVLDDTYAVKWMSDLFDASLNRYIGEKITTWIPQLSQLIKGSMEEIVVNYQNTYYRVSKYGQGEMLFFQNITDLQTYKNRYQDSRLVMGFVHLDNYNEELQYEDEQQMAHYETQLVSPIVQWANDHSMYVRRLRNDLFLIILNQQIYHTIQKEKFSIINSIKQVALDNDLAITASLGLAKGIDQLDELETMANQALALTQGRGGDQVAIKEYGKEVVFFGMGSQAQEKESRVKVRVMAHAIRDMILNSENVIIVGHKNMDFDCLGSAIGLANLVQSYQRPVSIVTQTGGIEGKLNAVLKQHEAKLLEKHHFVSQEDALNQLKLSTLVIMIDHHHLGQSSSENLIREAKKVAIIDHHRRVGDFEFSPIFMYSETSCSSCVEMITELFEYQTQDVNLTELESTIMYTGMVVDTNHFRVRSGSRTFAAASILKQLGANLSWSDNFLKDEFSEFELRSQMASIANKIDEYVIVAYEKQPVSRTLMSQVADSLLDIVGIEASFVIAAINGDIVGVSARSKNKINVQMMMEQLGGGGHFNAAAYQSNQESVHDIEEKIIEMIKEQKNESNSTE